MTAALNTALIILLSNQGHWFGGQPGTVEVHWAAQGQLPPAVLSWELQFAGACLAHERVALVPGDRPARIIVTPPEVRVRTEMHWIYRVHRKRDGELITRGKESIHIYSRNTLAGMDQRLKGKTLTVCDDADGLPTLLAPAHISYTLVDSDPGATAGLQTVTADMVLVGPNRLTDSPFGQTAYVNLARAGSSVLVFAQEHVERLAGYPLQRRPLPARLQWHMDHPLLEGFKPADLDSWLDRADTDVWAVQLPADEPVLEVAYWPREVPGEKPVLIDALIMAKQVGVGRLVLCQVPLGPWKEDPRTQALLRNGLNYLLSRPEPTPPPSQRTSRPKPPKPQPPSITIPAGDKQ